MSGGAHEPIRASHGVKREQKERTVTGRDEARSGHRGVTRRAVVGGLVLAGSGGLVTAAVAHHNLSGVGGDEYNRSSIAAIIRVTGRQPRLGILNL